MLNAQKTETEFTENSDILKIVNLMQDNYPSFLQDQNSSFYSTKAFPIRLY